MSKNPKGKPVFFSAGIHSQLHVISDLPEIDGFKQKAEHEEKVQHMLEEAVNMVVWDIKSNPPKRVEVL